MTVRARTTLAAAVVAACALIIGGITFVALLRASLTSDVQDVAQQQADTIASRVAEGADPARFAVSGDEDLIIQVVDPQQGRLVANSDGKVGKPIRSAGPSATVDDVPISDGTHSYRTVVRRVMTPAGPRVIVVGGSLEHVNDAVKTVTRMLWYGIPALLLVIALITWLFVARALQPVEMMRREVADISARDLNRRLAVPSTGDEISRLGQTMNAMLARLAAASERQRRFISDASHELRSPLSNLRALAEVAREHPDSTTLEGFSAGVLDEEDRLEQLVDDLLALARADEATLVTTRQDVDLDDLVLAEAARLRGTTKLRIDTSRVSPARIQADADALRRALRNIADNAARHAHSRIAFEVSREDGRARLAVVDDGAGVPEGERKRIFERFVRLDSARDRDSGGSGLGLAIVTEIARAHDGVVTVGDAPGTGARFELTLPTNGVATD